MPKYGEVRADGFRFRAYEKRGSRTYENWLSPEAWERRKKQRSRAARDRRRADPALRQKNVAATRRAQEKCRREKPELHLWRRVKTSAAARGLEFTITPENIVVPAVCPVLGIPIEVAGAVNADGLPSVDRIINSVGYVPGNVVVVSRRANVLKRDATVEELRAVASFYSRLLCSDSKFQS